jgi:hypothetical protein
VGTALAGRLAQQRATLNYIFAAAIVGVAIFMLVETWRMGTA